MFGIFQSKCPHCGKPINRDAKFCGYCGKPHDVNGRVCGVCGFENKMDAAFCGSCGRKLEQNTAPEIQRHHWARRPDDFAARIEAHDLKGILQKGLIIEPGTQALLIRRGVNMGSVPEGQYVLETLDQKFWGWLDTGITEQVTALLVETTPTDLDFALGGRFTSDPLPIGMSLRLQVAVTDPARCLINLLKGGDRLSKDDLRQYLYPEVVALMDQWLRSRTLQELVEDMGLRQKAEVALENALATSLSQAGLRFLQVRAVSLDLEPYDKVKGIRGKFALLEVEAKEELAGKRMVDGIAVEQRALETEEKVRRAREEVSTRTAYADIKQSHNLVELKEETINVEREERLVTLNARMRQAVMSDKFNEVRSEADFERFLDGIDHEKLLREKEKQDLLRTWAEEKDDQQRARAALVAKIELERDYELRAIKIRLQYGENSERQANELEISRKRRDAEFEFRRRAVQEELAIDQERQHAQVERRRIEIEQRKAELELAGFENRQRLDNDRAEAELGMELLARMKLIRHQEEERRLALLRLDEEEKRRIAREDEIRRAQEAHRLQVERIEVEERLRQAEREHTLRMQESTQDFELKRIAQLATLGAEALITLAGPEQARMLADLKRTEALKGMSEEQILAMAAERSPEVARAFQEKYRAIAAGEANKQTQEMYERLVAEKEASLRRSQEDADKRAKEISQAWERATDQSKSTAERAMDRMSDVAQAFARGQNNQPPVIINTPSGPQPVIIPGVGANGLNQAGGQTKTCPNCGRSVVATSRFCEYCGNTFKDQA